MAFVTEGSWSKEGLKMEKDSGAHSLPQRHLLLLQSEPSIQEVEFGLLEARREGPQHIPRGECRSGRSDHSSDGLLEASLAALATADRKRPREAY